MSRRSILNAPIVGHSGQRLQVDRIVLKSKRRGLIVGLAVGLLAVLIIGHGLWLDWRRAETDVAVIGDPAQTFLTFELQSARGPARLAVPRPYFLDAADWQGERVNGLRVRIPIPRRKIDSLQSRNIERVTTSLTMRAGRSLYWSND